MYEITTEQVTEAIEQVVAEFGEGYTYPKEHKAANGACQYVYDGKPDCIAGQVLHRLGVPIEQLMLWEDLACDGTVVCEAFIGDPGALLFLQAAQKVQDQGQTWGQALSEYQHRLRTERRVGF